MIYVTNRGDLGIVGKLGEGLHDFLKDKYQAVVANGPTFNETQIASGVLHDTILGPLLFIVALSDVISAAQIDILASYTSGTKVSHTIQNTGNIAKKVGRNMQVGSIQQHAV